jgi:hypothetical protein
MRRKPVARWVRVAVAAATWAATVVAVEAAAESDIGRTRRQLEERIELQLRLMDRGHPAVPSRDPVPERSHEESIEPWELVGV